MYATFRGHFNTGVALAGAGAIALAPLVIAAPEFSPFEHVVVQNVMRDANLLATTNPMLDLGTGLSGSLDGLLGGLATALNLDVTLDANGGVSPQDFIAAMSAAMMGGATGSGPLAGLSDLFTATVGALIDSLTGMAPTGIFDTFAQFIAAPLRFGLDALVNGNDALAGLTTNGISTFSGLLAGGATTTSSFLANAVNTGSQLFGGLFTGTGSLLSTGAASFAALLAPFAALPVIGPAVVAFGDVLAGFANGGSTVLGGIGTGAGGGGAVLAGLIADSVTALTHAATGGSGLLSGAVQTGSTALNDGLQGFQAAIDAVVPPSSAATVAPAGASSMLAAIRTGTPTTTAKAAAVTTPSVPTLTLPTLSPAASANTQTSGSGSSTIKLPRLGSLTTNATTGGSGSGTAKLPSPASLPGAITGAVKATTKASSDLSAAFSGKSSGSARVSGHVSGHGHAKAGK